MMRAATRLAATAPCSEAHAWRRGLILSHTHIGDLLYRSCSLPALRKALPDCDWTYAASPGAADVLANNPHLHEVLPIVTGEDSWQLTSEGLRQLRSRQFDVVLCSNTLRHYPDLVLAAKLGIPNLVGFTGKGFSGLINHPVRLRFPDRYASYFRAMVKGVTGSTENWELVPEIYPRGEDVANAEQLWQSFGLDGRVPVVACCSLTRQASGSWPEDVILDVLANARNRLEFEVVLCGAPGEAIHLQRIGTDLPFTVRVLAGQVGILAFAAFLAKCSVLLTADSGPRHIGNAMGVPVVFARNLSHSKVEAGRYCRTETDLAPDVEYLTDEETKRVTRSLSVDSLADVLLDKISA